MSDRPPPLSSHRIPLLGAPVVAPPPPPSALSVDEREHASVDLGGAFELASAELGFAAASWMFVAQVAAVSGDDGVHALRDDLGRFFAVLDFVAARWLEGARTPKVDAHALREPLGGARRVLVVGVEALHLDALARDLDATTRIGLVTYRLQRVDWGRVLDNFGGRIEPVDLAEFQGWAGLRSALLTFVYGTHGDLATVAPAFMRVNGPDVRTQFREIVGWDVLGGRLERYPRHLVETSASEMTALVRAAHEAAVDRAEH